MISTAGLAIDEYPRTRHIAGSRLQPGDADLEAVPFARSAGRAAIARVDGHRHERPLVPNRPAEGVDLFGEAGG